MTLLAYVMVRSAAPLRCADVDRSLAGEPLAFDPVTTLSGVYRVAGRQIYDGGEVVTVEPGTIFLMEPGASILVGFRSDPATVFMDGTEDEPILFCGTEAGKGHWLGLEFLTGTTPDTSLAHVVIEDAGLDGHAALLLDAPVDLVGVTLQGNLGVGLDAQQLGDGSDALRITDNSWPAVLGSAPSITNLPEGDYTGNDEDVLEVVGHDNADVVFHDRGCPTANSANVWSMGWRVARPCLSPTRQASSTKCARTVRFSSAGAETRQP